MYVLHGLSGIGLVGLTIAHIYFAIRPEKIWITKGMVFGDITQRGIPQASRSAALGRRRRNTSKGVNRLAGPETGTRPTYDR